MQCAARHDNDEFLQDLNNSQIYYKTNSNWYFPKKRFVNTLTKYIHDKIERKRRIKTVNNIYNRSYLCSDHIIEFRLLLTYHRCMMCDINYYIYDQKPITKAYKVSFCHLCRHMTRPNHFTLLYFNKILEIRSQVLINDINRLKQKDIESSLKIEQLADINLDTLVSNKANMLKSLLCKCETKSHNSKLKIQKIDGIMAKYHDGIKNHKLYEEKIKTLKETKDTCSVDEVIFIERSISSMQEKINIADDYNIANLEEEKNLLGISIVKMKSEINEYEEKIYNLEEL